MVRLQPIPRPCLDAALRAGSRRLTGRHQAPKQLPLGAGSRRRRPELFRSSPLLHHGTPLAASRGRTKRPSSCRWGPDLVAVAPSGSAPLRSSTMADAADVEIQQPKKRTFKKFRSQWRYYCNKIQHQRRCCSL